MQKLRNLRLAVRLGVAFGALALGLLVVSVVAFRSTRRPGTKVDALAVDVPAVHARRGRHRRAHARGGRTCSRSICTSTTATSRRRTRSRSSSRRSPRRTRRRSRACSRCSADARTPRRAPRPTASRSCAAGHVELLATRARRSRPRARRRSTTSRSAPARATLYTEQICRCTKRSSAASPQLQGRLDVHRRRGAEGHERDRRRPSARS